MLITHKIQLNPNKEQIKYIHKCIGTARFVYNWAYDEWHNMRNLGEKVNCFILKKKFNSIKKEFFPWVYEVTKCAAELTFPDIQKAFVNFFQKRSGYPTKRKKHRYNSFHIANDQFHLKKEGYVHLPHIKYVKLFENLRFTGKIIGATISNPTKGKYFIAITVDTEENLYNRTENQGVIGIDLGIGTLITLSNGSKYNVPNNFKKINKRIRLLSKNLSRKEKGSQNRIKDIIKLSRCYFRLKNIRNDNLHKMTYYLTSYFNKIGIETLDIKSMLKNKYHARQISKMGWYEFKRQLLYKAEINKVEIIEADKNYPSTQLCSTCNYRSTKKPVYIREWECESCGVLHDRDVNAAMNLQKLAEGSPVTVFGDDVIPRGNLGLLSGN